MYYFLVDKLHALILLLPPPILSKERSTNSIKSINSFNVNVTRLFMCYNGGNHHKMSVVYYILYIDKYTNYITKRDSAKNIDKYHGYVWICVLMKIDPI